MENGLTTEVEYIRAIDGDTIEFKVERTFNVRLRNFDAVELKSLWGEDARNFVARTLSAAQKIQIFIPTNDPHKLMDVNSFERIVADVFINGENLVDIIRVAGYEKPKPKSARR